ncbi:MAG: hypothetical protein GVY29_00655 [Spirochaetes bacterium]|jgi:hypothetical protein|nr:hypothetical protein [Spirochaetota bacterium]
MADNNKNQRYQGDLSSAFKNLRDHLKELEQRELLDTAERRWKRDRKDEQTQLRDPNDEANRN